MVKITIQELRTWCTFVLNSAEDVLGKTIALDEDYYYWVSTDDVFNLDKEPQSLIGSLVDDINGLWQIFDKGVVVSTVDFDRFAAILMFLSYRCSNTKVSSGKKTFLTVSIDELKKICDLLLDALERAFDRNFTLINDVCWAVDLEGRYKVYDKVSYMKLSLFNEIANLRKMASNRRLGDHDFERLGMIFLALGEKVETEHRILV